jgi:hypothetical protein
MSEALGRYCELMGMPEVTDLKYGMDFRKPEYRREVFQRMYEAHLTYKAHPGCVYFLFPYIANKCSMDIEQKLWFGFINGSSQHPPTTWMIWKQFPDLGKLDIGKFSTFFNDNYKRWGWDTDRRYHRKAFIASVECYRKHLRGGSQVDFWSDLTEDAHDEYDRFRRCWKKVINEFYSFGRLSTFSYLEYLRIIGLNIDCDQLFMDDMDGSKSHRNGCAKVLGRDDLDWHDSTGFDGKYGPGQIEWLAHEAEVLLKEAKARFAGKPFERDVSYFTLESVFCTYKSCFRKNRRYPGVYADMLYNRLKDSEKSWPQEDFSMFWEARRACLPKQWRLEDNPADPGLTPEKQNHFRNTGEMINLDFMWPCFKNNFNDRIALLQGKPRTGDPRTLSDSAA